MARVVSDNNQSVSGSFLADYSNVTAHTSSGLLAHCASGLGPTGTDDNTALGIWYFNGAQLPYGLCQYPIVHLIRSQAASLTNYIGVINLWQCGPLTTTAEGVYTCFIMDSSMMNQTSRLGVYFIGRSKSCVKSRYRRKYVHVHHYITILMYYF